MAAASRDITVYLPSSKSREPHSLISRHLKLLNRIGKGEVSLFGSRNPERSRTESRFASLFSKVCSRCVTCSSVTVGFSATGAYPFDSITILDETVASSFVIEQEHDGNEAPSQTCQS
jgi:hypothetical protein